jgi:outer membrane protein assembly factor BamB
MGEAMRGTARRRSIALVAGAAAVLLAVLVTTVLVLDDDGEPGAGSEVWRAEDREILGSSEERRIVSDGDWALWAHDGVVTRVSSFSVTGYQAADGETLWRQFHQESAADEMTDDMDVCGASESTNAQGVGVVLLGDADGDACTMVAAIDTRTGSRLWSREASLTYTSDVEISVGDAAVTIGPRGSAFGDEVLRFDLATGAPLPVPELTAEDPPGCDTIDNGYVGLADGHLVTMAACHGSDTGPYDVGSYVFAVHDADTGELNSTAAANDVIRLDGGLSGDPLITLQDLGARIVAYSDAGEELWRLDDDNERSPTLRLDPTAHAVVGGVLVLKSLADPEGETVYSGHDLRSGERLWRARLPEHTELLGVDGGRLLLGTHEGDWEEAELRLRWLDPTDGTEEPVGVVPYPLDGSLPLGIGVAFDADHIYLSGSADSSLRLRALKR